MSRSQMGCLISIVLLFPFSTLHVSLPAIIPLTFVAIIFATLPFPHSVLHCPLSLLSRYQLVGVGCTKITRVITRALSQQEISRFSLYHILYNGHLISSTEYN